MADDTRYLPDRARIPTILSTSPRSDYETYFEQFRGLPNRRLMPGATYGDGLFPQVLGSPVPI